MITRASLSVWVLLSLGLTAGAPDGERALHLDPALPYQAQRRNPVTYDVDFSVVVTAPHDTEVLKVWLPLPQNDAGQEVTEGGLTTFPLKVPPRIGLEPLFGNQFAYFEFPEPEGAQVIRHTFRVQVWELRWNVDPQQVVRVREWPAGFAPYLRGETQAVVVNEQIRDQLRAIVPEPRGEVQDLTHVLHWVHRRMTYDHKIASLRASSIHALEQGRGHCSDYHGLCASLGRALGYPTRVTYGIHTFPKNSPSHCKLEAYLAPYGWVSFDVSETQRLTAAIETDGRLDAAKKKQLLLAAERRLFGGFRDNTWFVQTRGSDYDLVPPATRRVPVVRTIYAEADGQPLPDPDPANPDENRFAWMTVHQFVPDRQVPYPFKDWKTLENQP